MLSFKAHSAAVHIAGEDRRYAAVRGLAVLQRNRNFDILCVHSEAGRHVREACSPSASGKPQLCMGLMWV